MLNITGLTSSNRLPFKLLKTDTQGHANLLGCLVLFLIRTVTSEDNTIVGARQVKKAPAPFANSVMQDTAGDEVEMELRMPDILALARELEEDEDEENEAIFDDLDEDTSEADDEDEDSSLEDDSGSPEGLSDEESGDYGSSGSEGKSDEEIFDETDDDDSTDRHDTTDHHSHIDMTRSRTGTATLDASSKDSSSAENEEVDYPVILTESQHRAVKSMHAGLQSTRGDKELLALFHSLLLSIFTDQPTDADENRFHTPIEAFIIASNIRYGGFRKPVSVAPDLSKLQYGLQFTILNDAMSSPDGIAA
jgi:hypothetical protein